MFMGPHPKGTPRTFTLEVGSLGPGGSRLENQSLNEHGSIPVVLAASTVEMLLGHPNHDNNRGV